MRFVAACLAAALLVACSGDEPDVPEAPVAFVHLFEWRWNDVARECEQHLGPAGFTAVQVSPPQEHVTGPEWWTRYQVVSYLIESRGGSRQEFAAMVRRCNAAGVDIYVDAIINHMAGMPERKGVAGSPFSEYDYPAVPYAFDDFHHCGRNADDRITDYQDKFEVQNCQLGTLDDLDTGKPAVQVKVADYLNDLLGLGAAGFRLDAAKHIANEEIAAILAQVAGEPFVFQEVIDHGTEPIKARNYLRNGMVTEFRYGSTLVDAFERGNLEALTGLGSDPEWLPSDRAVVFVDNHDTQRHSGDENLNYKDGARYELAVAFMLAYPYGYPKVMSSYNFEDGGQGPPESSPFDDAGCGAGWICEHRSTTITDMLAFRRAVAGTDLSNWRIDDEVVSFGRGDKGHVVINTAEEAATIELATNLPDGNYGGGSVTAGRLSVTVPATGIVALVSPASTGVRN